MKDIEIKGVKFSEDDVRRIYTQRFQHGKSGAISGGRQYFVYVGYVGVAGVMVSTQEISDAYNSL